MKITLLGDSIRQQYEPIVREMLGDEFEIWAPEENCRFSQYTLRGIFDWERSMEGSEIVHWNNGHWDVCRLFDYGTFTDEETYLSNMLRIYDILKKRYSTVIFSTTTPVRNSNRYNSNEDIDRFNSKLAQLLRERGAIINDLNALLRDDIDRYICEDTIHLTEEGIRLCANQVADYIREVAGVIKTTPTRVNELDNEDGLSDVGAPVLI